MKILLSLSFLLLGAPSGTKPATPIGKKIASFQLRDFRGTEHTLAEVRDAKVVVVAFVGTECPLAKLYAPRLEAMAKRLAPQGVKFLGINSNQQDSITEIDHFVRTHEISFPMLKDPGNVVADLFGAVRTPEVFVLDQDRVVRYWGRVDDQFGVGYSRPEVTKEDLASAIGEVLAGKPVTNPVAPAPGCYIGRVRTPDPNSEITYSKHIAPIMQNRCQECHRAGEIAPFSLMTYEDTVGWAETIAEVVEEQRMPPWHANPEYGHFLNDALLSDEEKSLIARWVSAGAPEGDKKDLPPPVQFAEGWRIPEPDAVFEMPYEFHVPADGVLDYKHIVVDPGFTEDKWVQFAEAKAGNRSVVHHIIVFVRPPDNRRDELKVEGDFGGGRFLVATAPGARPLMLGDGYAKLVPAGSKLIFQMHYTPNGTPQTDKSSIGLVFADPEKVRKKVSVANPGQFAFRIPPHDPNYKIAATHFFKQDSHLIAFLPHMHRRGKSFRYEVEYPDGKQEILLDVPRYDFNWQNTYVLDEPKLMPRGTKMTCTAYFDNSAENLSNPNPNVSVTWGEQTWQEMMFGFFEWAPARDDLKGKTRTEHYHELTQGTTPELDTKMKSLAQRASMSGEDFQRFAEALREELPQLDRVCVTMVDDGLLKVAIASEGETRNGYGPTGFSRAANGFALARFAEQTKTLVHDNLREISGFDIRLLSRSFHSSVHIPFQYRGKPATVNFWSGEAKAFPPSAVKFLENVVDAAVPNRVLTQNSPRSTTGD